MHLNVPAEPSSEALTEPFTETLATDTDGSLGSFSATIDKRLRMFLLGTITSNVPLDICASTIEGAGLGVIAQEALPAGAEVFRVNKPFAVGLSQPKTTCDNCFSNTETKNNSDGLYTAEKLKLKDCQRCRLVKYCSKACQVSAWSDHHKAECKASAGKGPLNQTSPTAQQPQPLKICFLRIMQKFARKEVSPEQRDALDNLEGHREESVNDSMYTDFLNSSFVSRESEAIMGLTSDEIFDIYCKLLTNSISIRQPDTDYSLGIALDLFCSMINHSCDPNVFFFFEGSQLRCRTLRPVAAGDELFISYTDMTYDVQSRRHELSSVYYFQCACPRCKTEMGQLGLADLKNADLRMKMQEKLLQCEPEIVVQGLTPGAIEKRLRSVWSSLSPELTRQLSLEHGWPEHEQPLPDVRFFIARITQSTDTEYSLKTLVKLCFDSFPRIYGGHRGREWVMAFCLLVFTLRLFTKKKAEAGTHRNLGDWSLVYIVYLNAMTKQAEHCYGSDTAFVKANQKLLRDETAALTPEVARSAGLISQFQADQKELFKWAGVSGVEGVVLPEAGLVLD